MVADTYTNRIGLIRQGAGNNSNSWGDIMNASDFDIIDRAIAGYVTEPVTGGTLVLDTVIPPAGAHPLAEMMVAFTGVLASNQLVQVPNVSKMWLVVNSTTGAFTLKFKTAAGAASAAIPQGGSAIVICDGANNLAVGLSTTLRDVQWLGADGTLAAPGISFVNEAGTGLRRKGAGVMSLVVGGVEIATISATGIDIASTAAVTVGGVAPVPPGTEVQTAAIVAPSGWYFEYGQTVARAGDVGLLGALTIAFTATTNGTAVLTGVSQDLRGLGIEGSVLEGTGMFTGATIVSVDSATQITMSNAATNSVAGGAVRAFPYGNGDGSTTFALPDARGTVAAGRDNMGGTAANKLTAAGSGINGLRLNVTGGAQSVTLITANLPPYTPAGTITDGPITITGGINGTTAFSGQPGAGAPSNSSPIVATQNGSTFAGTAQGGTSAAFFIAQPTRIRNVMIKR